MPQLFLFDDVSGQFIHVYAAPPENVQPMMSVEYSAIPPGLEAVFLTRHQGINQFFGGHAIHLSKL